MSTVIIICMDPVCKPIKYCWYWME